MDYQTNGLQEEVLQPVGKVRTPAPRRVGTVTMGAALVGTGILLLAGQFSAFNVAAVLRWSPVILILLGLEILLGYAFHRSEKLRYDFLSMVVCLLLICGSALCSIIPSVIRYEQNESRAESQIAQQLEGQVAAAVGEENIGSLHVNVNSRYSWEWDSLRVPTVDEMAQGNAYDCWVYLELLGEFPDRAAFAEAVAEAAGRIEALGLQPLQQVDFTGYNARGVFYADVDRWGLKTPAGELAYRVAYDGEEEEPPEEELG